ncbi:hypothetical protein TNCV_4485861 [Trichonephila clavipes]|nr:hypothetical protein TNCV_4485861 [Trichonephila clavipes]
MSDLLGTSASILLRWPSEYYRQNRDSSEKTTLCPYIILICRSPRQSWCLSLHWIVKGGRSNGHRSDSPCYCKRHRIIREHIRRTDLYPRRSRFFISNEITLVIRHN